jgi:hypothetical protein
MKNHFKFNIIDPKQLMIAMTGAFSTWAATGFQRDMPHLGYVVVGFVTGGLMSHNSMASPNVMPDSHIQTPYMNNINDGTTNAPPKAEELGIYKAEGADVKKIIKINSGLIK